MKDANRPNNQKDKHLIGYGCLLLASLLLILFVWWTQNQTSVRFRTDAASSADQIGNTSEATAGAGDQGDIPGDRRETDPEPERIPVYLVGAVKKPGIYQVVPGTYLYQLIESAGGLTDDAAADQINLAAAISVNQLIRLPTQAEADAGYDFSLQTADDAGQELVDLNRADQARLETLPGIGPATARAIIAYREENGPFERIEDLMQVPGIKEARFSTLQDLVMAGGS